MKKISLIAAAMFAAVTSMPAAYADYTPNVNFSGYMRSGVHHGSSAFTSKRYVNQIGRLGNENDTFGEIGLGSDVVKVEDTTFSVFTMLAYGSDGRDHDWDNNVACRQFYVNVNGLIDSDKDANIWIGKRYYKREDTHINDFYYYNVSGTGTGIDTLTVGPGKLNLAWTREDTDKVKYQSASNYKNNDYDTPNPQNAKVNYFDTRYEFPAWNDATIQLGATYVNVEKQKDGAYSDFTTNGKWRDALNLSVELNQGFSAGWNKTVFQSFIGSTAQDIHFGSSAGVYNDDGTGYRLINTGDTHITDRFGFQHVLNVAYSSGYETFDNRKSISAVIRPFYQLTKMTRFIAEAGAFVQKTELNDGSHYTDRANKYTFAYAIAPDASNFWSRPELRFYVSYVNGCDWAVDKDTKASYVGGFYPGKSNKTSDLVFGAQVEAWW
ncbi:carbohydrate porin [Succinivibrio dextrinosolvens]|uniref:carbohydrate porin n=1 Tax=Succinivibrio dextrinosolvens TaxID=83771 RepID=UPI0019241636|nr:carbohydrate porin [Succinivibrio dextrinosolvens]